VVAVAGEAGASALDRLNADLVGCRACPRLVAWREQVARAPRAAYAGQAYWARPVPGFGDPAAWLLIVGLAPGAHGSNRTGRMFTGDRSGEWLFAALHRFGLASRPTATDRGDGLALSGAYVTAAVRCAPPGNKPATEEWVRCRPYVERELDLLPGVRVIVALGAFAWGRVMAVLRDRAWPVPRPTPAFGHGAEVTLRPAAPPGIADPPRPLTVLASYHPSQQNTFTGKLTVAMFDRVWRRAVGLRPTPHGVPPPEPRAGPRTRGTGC
jgi:uracil-DNA glycosylase